MYVCEEDTGTTKTLRRLFTYFRLSMHFEGLGDFNFRFEDERNVLRLRFYDSVFFESTMPYLLYMCQLVE